MSRRSDIWGRTWEMKCMHVSNFFPLSCKPRPSAAYCQTAEWGSRRFIARKKSGALRPPPAKITTQWLRIDQKWYFYAATVHAGSSVLQAKQTWTYTNIQSSFCQEKSCTQTPCILQTLLEVALCMFCLKGFTTHQQEPRILKSDWTLSSSANLCVIVSLPHPIGLKLANLPGISRPEYRLWRGVEVKGIHWSICKLLGRAKTLHQRPRNCQCVFSGLLVLAALIFNAHSFLVIFCRSCLLENSWKFLE